MANEPIEEQRERALQGLRDHDRAADRGDVEDAVRRFAVDSDGYELPCVALCAVAS
jgi:hypothetical protein